MKSFGILQLPSKATLQAYTGAFLHEPEASSHCIAEQMGCYIIFNEQCRQSGKQEPKSDAVMIFDYHLLTSRTSSLLGFLLCFTGVVCHQEPNFTLY